MLIAYNCPDTVTWTLNTSNGAALLSSDYSGLSDGSAGTQTAFRWNTLSTNNLTLTGTGFSLPIAAGAPFYFVAGLVNTTLPKGTSGSPTQLIVSANGALNSAGSITQALKQYPQPIIPSPAQQPYVSAWAVFTPAQLSGSTAITQVTFTLHAGAGVSNAQVFNIGELVFGCAVDLPVAELDPIDEDPSKLNRSSGNQGWPVLRKTFRRLPAIITPETWTQYIGNTSAPYSAGYPSMRDLFYALAVNSKCLIVSRWRQRGVTAQDADLIQRTAMMARMLNPPGTKFSASSEYSASTTLNFEELL